MAATQPFAQNAAGSKASATLCYSRRDVALYALAVGATVDNLDLIYERCGPVVLPSFAVVPSLPVVRQLVQRIGGNIGAIVHLRQQIRLQSVIPPEGEVDTYGEILGIYAAAGMAQSCIETKTYSGTQLLCTTRWTLGHLQDSCQDAQSRLSFERIRVPHVAPTHVFDLATAPNQAALYRLCSGDLNPIHIEHAVAVAAGFRAPILHGLCTLGMAARVTAERVLAGPPSRVRWIEGEFRRPVYPGETLRMNVWAQAAEVVVRASTLERPGERELLRCRVRTD